MKVESSLCFFQLIPLVTNHGWLENPLRMEVLKRTSPVSMVHGFQPAMFDDTGGYQPLKKKPVLVTAHLTLRLRPFCAWYGRGFLRQDQAPWNSEPWNVLWGPSGTVNLFTVMENQPFYAFLLGQLMISMAIFNSYAARNYGKSACLMVKLTIHGHVR